MTPFQEFIYTRTYSRWLDDKERRETWDETVDRYAEFFRNRLIDDERAGKITLNQSMREEFEGAIEGIRELENMPSMRALWTAGEALRRNNLVGYNCSALSVDRIRAFAEALMLLLCGCGVGFSVCREEIAKLPCVPESIRDSSRSIVFEDSKEGWAEGYLEFMTGLYDGVAYDCDLSLIRPAGARLVTFGGRSSGPLPLSQLLEYTKRKFLSAVGRKLNSLECHDIMCFIASIVVVGGTRRAATISFSNPSDQRMVHAKDGEFWLKNPQRTLANNTTVYTEKPGPDLFMENWLDLMRSQTGERGIFNREGTKKFIQRKASHRNTNYEFIANPCFEIILRPSECCNLSEVVIRPNDDIHTLCRKVESSVILGMIQATLTDFQFVGPEWKKNCEEERLLGVSLTGLRDHNTLNHINPVAKGWLAEMRNTAWKTAQRWSEYLNINLPASLSCIKPSGTVSLLVDTSPGIHTRFSDFYIRRVRVAQSDPLCQLMIDQGVPWQPETGESVDSFKTAVFEFPFKAPENAITSGSVSAIESLEYWKMIKEYWCDMNPSVTIYVKEDEWVEVGAWVYKNWDDVGGIAFLPKDDCIYPLAPYEKITETQYDVLVDQMPEIDFSKLSRYELQDQTEGATEYACVSGSCELI